MNRLTQANFRCKTVFCCGNPPENAVSQIFSQQDKTRTHYLKIQNIASRKKWLVFLQKTQNDAYRKSVCLCGYIHISFEKHLTTAVLFIHKKGSAYIIFTEISAKQLPYLFALFDKKYYNKWRLKG